MESPSSKTGLWTAAIVLLVVLVGGTVAALRSAGVFSPSQSSATTTPRARPHEAVAAILDAARSQMARENAAQAAVILEAGVSQYPDFPDLRQAYAEALVWLGRFEDAYAQQVEGIERGAIDARAEFVAGTLASRLNRPQVAADHYAAAQTKDPTNPDYPLYLAQVQIKLHESDKAKANLVLSAQLDPDNAITWGTLADILVRENKPDMALQQVAKARTLQPTAGAWKIIEARALLRKAEPERALLILDTLSEADRLNPSVLATIGQCHGMLSQPDKAAEVYRRASDAKPTDADLAFETALWFDRAGDSANAVVYALRAARHGHEGAQRLVDRLSEPK